MSRSSRGPKPHAIYTLNGASPDHRQVILSRLDTVNAARRVLRLPEYELADDRETIQMIARHPARIRDGSRAAHGSRHALARTGGPVKASRKDIKPARPDGRGVDLATHYGDVERLARSFFRQCAEVFRAASRNGYAGRRVEADDFVQDVALTIHRLNGKPCAFDPTKGTFGRWVWFVCRSVASHGTARPDLDTLYTDPDDIGHVSAAADSMTEGVRAYLESNEAGLRAYARAVEMDKMIGQGRLFDVEAEWPELAAAAE